MNLLKALSRDGEDGALQPLIFWGQELLTIALQGTPQFSHMFSHDIQSPCNLLSCLLISHFRSLPLALLVMAPLALAFLKEPIIPNYWPRFIFQYLLGLLPRPLPLQAILELIILAPLICSFQAPPPQNSPASSCILLPCNPIPCSRFARLPFSITQRFLDTAHLMRSISICIPSHCNRLFDSPICHPHSLPLFHVYAPTLIKPTSFRLGNLDSGHSHSYPHILIAFLAL